MGQFRFWRSYGIPVAVCVAAFAGVNYLYLHTSFGDRFTRFLPYPLAVYLLAGSGLALAFLCAALGGDRLHPEELGIGRSGWSAPRRLLGLTLLVLLSFGQCVLLRSELPGGAGRVSLSTLWAEYCFWYVLLLSASLAELLVFAGAGFCLLRRGLREGGVGRFWAFVAATAFASVGFGLFHYTYDVRFHSYVFPLMGEMLFIVLVLLATKNFYAALAVHNAFAAIGFLREDRLGAPFNQVEFVHPTVLASFLIPFLVLHGIEWWNWRRTRPGPDRVSG